MSHMKLVSLDEFIAEMGKEEKCVQAIDSVCQTRWGWNFGCEYYKSTYVSISWHEKDQMGKLMFRMDLSPEAGNRYWIVDKEREEKINNETI